MSTVYDVNTIRRLLANAIASYEQRMTWRRERHEEVIVSEARVENNLAYEALDVAWLSAMSGDCEQARKWMELAATHFVQALGHESADDRWRRNDIQGSANCEKALIAGVLAAKSELRERLAQVVSEEPTKWYDTVGQRALVRMLRSLMLGRPLSKRPGKDDDYWGAAAWTVQCIDRRDSTGFAAGLVKVVRKHRRTSAKSLYLYERLTCPLAAALAKLAKEHGLAHPESDVGVASCFLSEAS